ncbi:MAG: asparaginase [Pyrinomonadaceae bacterium]
MVPPILAEVIRGDTVESVHRGHVSVINGLGLEIASIGDPSIVTFFRSSAKPFQALPFILSGAADELGFTDDEIAMACASHSGEKMHTSIVANMLERLKLSEKDLRCGVHMPFYEKEAERMLKVGETPTQLHNNCSGKHAAMLAMAKQMGADISNYESPFNPVQKAILRSVSNFSGIPIGDIKCAVDGCAAPNFAISVSAMAQSFANLVNPARFDEDIQNACKRIVDAMIKYPKLIGGTERLDTMLMEAAPGKIVSKVGADGVWLCGVLPSEKYPTGLGIALKIEDGDDLNSRPVVAIELLRQLGLFAPDTLPDLSPMPIKNRRGDNVGEIAAVLKLESLQPDPSVAGRG